MSVIVKGMEMPTNCLQCSFVRIVSDHNSDHFYCGCNANCMLGEYVGEYFEGVGRHEGCPLVELPEKHGRLIDGDELADGCDDPHWCRWLSEIEDMPTIVEAEGDDG